MKNLTIIFIFYSLNLIFIPEVALATEFIWPQIPFIQGADYCNFKENLEKGRLASRRDYIYDALPLMNYGATTYEAYNLILAFDEFYEQNRNTAALRLQVSLEEKFKSEFTRLYNYFNPQKQNLGFRTTLDSKNLLNIARSLKSQGGVQPHKIEDLEYIAYGTFAIASSCNGNIDLTLDIIHLNTGDVITFFASGTPNEAMVDISFQLFDRFQRTKFPSIISNTNKMGLKLLGTPTGRLTDKVDWNTANRSCASMNGRLPTAQEIKDIAMYGRYAGGISLHHHGNYCLNEKNAVYVSDFVGQEEQSFNLINDKVAYFFCVK